MEQRPLRLGDIVDDYCPRERRITNHAIVAIVGVDIKQTRCSTCDAEHVYKEARMPRRKKAEPTAFEQVLSDVTGGQRVVPTQQDDQDDVEAAVPEPAQAAPVAAAPRAAPGPAAPVKPPSAPPAARPPVAAAPTHPDPAPDEGSATATADLDTPHDAWLSHRRLIRASLPKVEGELPPARPIPEFTMHQPPPRPGRGRFGQPWHGGGERHHRGGNPNANGNGNAHGNGFRHGHGRPADSGGQPGQPGEAGDGQPRKSGRRRRRRRPRSQP